MSTETNKTALLKLSDDSIGMIRDLLQLSILLGINIIDNLRAMRFEVNPATGNLVPAEEYVVAYNAMIQDLEAKAQAALEPSVVSDAEVPTEAIIVTDKDNKLVN